MRSYSDPGGKHYTRKTGDEVSSSDYPSYWAGKAEQQTSLGQIAFEKWAEIHQARPVWYDLPDYMKEEWESIAKAVTDKFIESMAGESS